MILLYGAGGEPGRGETPKTMGSFAEVKKPEHALKLFVRFALAKGAITYEWKSVIRARVKGTTCPVCAERAILSGYNDLATNNPELVTEWNAVRNGTLKPQTVSPNSLRSVWWRCSFGHSWKARIADRAIGGEHCRECTREFHKALPQLLVMLYARKEDLKILVNTDTQIGLTLETYSTRRKPRLHRVNRNSSNRLFRTGYRNRRL